MTPTPTSDTRLWLQQLPAALDILFQEGFEYKKAGFVLLDLCSAHNIQGDLLVETAINNTRMMTVLDAINQRFGRQMLRPASVGFATQRWHMNQRAVSPAYTTNWREILSVRA